MSFDGYDDELYWNEHQWEAHLDELERRSEQLRKFITSDPKGNQPRWIVLLRENLDENEAVDAFIEEELLLDEAYFPEDEDDWEDEEDDWEDDDFFFSHNEDPFLDNDEDDDFDAGEEWKFLSDDFTRSDYGSLENLQTYSTSKLLAVDILKWAESVPEQYHNNTYHDFVGEILKIGAKLAGGYSFGFEQDYLGGNIAYNKKAIYCANNALQLLQKHPICLLPCTEGCIAGFLNCVTISESISRNCATVFTTDWNKLTLLMFRPFIHRSNKPLKAAGNAKMAQRKKIANTGSRW